MAIGVRTRPEFIVAGAVQRIADRNKKDDGSLYARDVVVETNGGGVYVRIWARDLVHSDIEHVDTSASPLEETIGRETEEAYEAALGRLKPEEREAVIARIEMGQSYEEIATLLGKPSPDAARMTVSRALVRLAREMDRHA